jgi:CBS domain-containing protein
MERHAAARPVHVEHPVRLRRTTAEPIVADLLEGRTARIRAEYGLDSLSAILFAREIEGLAVVDAKERPVGVVTRDHLLRAVLDRANTEERETVRLRLRDAMEEAGAPGFHTERVLGGAVGDIMRPVPVTLAASASLAQAAAAIARSAPDPVVVLDPSGRATGVLTASDLVRWMARRLG